MKKLSKIVESLWADLQDRSSGDVIRKEDDVNNFDLNGLRDYIKSKYDTRIHIDQRWSFISVDDIQVGPKTRQLLLVFDLDSAYDGKVIQLPYSFMEKFNDVFKKMEDTFSLDYKKARDEEEYEELLNVGFINIYPKDKSEITNKFFLEVLDFIYKELNSGIKESLWTDLQDRSSGDIIRKEDDINSLDMEGLYEYIFDLYEQINPFPMPLKSGEGTSDKKYQYFAIPIFKVNHKVYRLDAVFTNDKISSLALMASDVDIRDFKQALIDNFDVTIRSDTSLKIEEKDGTLTNQTCMKLIRVIVENAPEPYLKKRD